MHDPYSLIDLIRSGGVHYNISGSTPDEVFADIAARVTLPPSVDGAAFVTGLSERERLMTTAVGHGIAIPHPRTPLVERQEDERIFVCFLDRPVNFDSLDGKPVYAAFVLMSGSSQTHLRSLSQLSYLFQREEFRSLLREKPDTEELTNTIQKYLKESF